MSWLLAGEDCANTREERAPMGTVLPGELSIGYWNLLQLCILRFGGLEDRYIGVSVFPQCEEILI